MHEGIASRLEEQHQEEKKKVGLYGVSSMKRIKSLVLKFISVTGGLKNNF